MFEKKDTHCLSFEWSELARTWSIFVRKSATSCTYESKSFRVRVTTPVLIRSSRDIVTTQTDDADRSLNHDSHTSCFWDRGVEKHKRNLKHPAQPVEYTQRVKYAQADYFYPKYL